MGRLAPHNATVVTILKADESQFGVACLLHDVSSVHKVLGSPICTLIDEIEWGSTSLASFAQPSIAKSLRENKGSFTCSILPTLLRPE